MYTFKCIERSKEKTTTDNLQRRTRDSFKKKNRNVVNLQYHVSFGYMAKCFSYLYRYIFFRLFFIISYSKALNIVP